MDPTADESAYAYAYAHAHAHDDAEHQDGHRRLHGAVASHFPAQPLDGETWVDFLREADSGSDPDPDSRPSSSSSMYPHPPTETISSASSSDRKRRLTSAESPLRRPSSIHMRGAGTTTDPIVLDPAPEPASASMRERPLPPPPTRRESDLVPLPTPPTRRESDLVPPPPSPTRRESDLAPLPTPPTRRESDLVPPPWQPDSAVTHCPVCDRQFTFLFRKHHCRKCGRVVCSQCSPHRITIPRQYIVHPPSDGSSTIIDLTGDDDDDANPMANFGPFRNPALGGGAEVRVCNPCVPDPNYSLPPQYPSPSSHAYGPPPSARPDYNSPSHQRAHRQSSSVHAVAQTSSHGQPQSSRDAVTNRRVSYHDASRSDIFWPTPLPSPADNQQPHPQRTAQGLASVRGVDMLPRQSMGALPQPPPIQQLNPRRRRQIAEEDECPICGGELPAKGPYGDDTARTQHVEECISLHSASPAPASNMRPQAHTSTSLPVTRTRGMSSVGNGEGASSHSHRLIHAARMFPYIATEKDCVDPDGSDAECNICMDEFRAGDKMARLVCWCKFHQKCIKIWWEVKGPGACPTHQPPAHQLREE